MSKDQYKENDVGYRIIRWDSVSNAPYKTDESFVIPPFDFDVLDSNITFGELQSKSFEEVSVWVEQVRTELENEWGLGRPTYVGKEPDEIRHQFDNLKDYPIDDFLVQDDLYPEYIGFIKNFSKIASGVNQFFQGLLESRIHGKSIYDYLSKEELYDDFKYTIVQKIRFDKMYMFSKYLENDGKYDTTLTHHNSEVFNREDADKEIKFEVNDEGHFQRFYEDKICKSHMDSTKNEDEFWDWGSIGFWFEDYDFNQQNEKKQRVKLSSSFVKEFVKTNPVGYLTDNREGFNIKGDEEYFTIRYYDMDRKVFPQLFQTLRVGLNQVAVNFPPLTARWIYEKYLGELPSQRNYKVYDPCSGWGGRLLGSLCSNLPIHYIGTEVNKRNYFSYDELESFYKDSIGWNDKQTFPDSKHPKIGIDEGNTQEVWFEGSEVIHQNKMFMDKHENTIDLVFTSPPYFDREEYSEDKEQSFLKFPDYDNWLEGYLERTLLTAYELLKVDRYCIINICDIKVGNNIIPLEQDTIRTAMKVGFDYVGKMGMCMTRMIGLNPTNSKNFWLDRSNYTTYKTEPILIFMKNVKYPWEDE